MKKVNCKAYAQEILDKAKDIKGKKKLVILSGNDDPAAGSYLKSNVADCKYCKVPYVHIRANSYEELIDCIVNANTSPFVGGIIVQHPLPTGWEAATKYISPEKDIDGTRPDSLHNPCTPEGILYLMKKEIGVLAGLSVLVVGKGKLVGRPLIDMLLEEGCTLTVAHSRTKNLDSLLTQNDVIVSAVGKAGLIDLKKCEAQMVVDAGINFVDGKLCGDCYNFDPDDGSDMKVTTVPGGVGVMTRAMLIKHMIG